MRTAVANGGTVEEPTISLQDVEPETCVKTLLNTDPKHLMR